MIPLLLYQTDIVAHRSVKKLGNASITKTETDKLQNKLHRLQIDCKMSNLGYCLRGIIRYIHR